jgi:hypothetical protein
MSLEPMCPTNETTVESVPTKMLHGHHDRLVHLVAHDDTVF